MSGFFTIEQYQNTSPKVMSVAGCGVCKLHKQCNTPKMKPTGDGKKDILFIAEASGEKEDRRGLQLIGKSGQRLRKTLKKLKIDLDRDARKTNALCCRPPKNRDPKNYEIDACRPNLLKEIERSKPKLIIPLGGFAIQSLLGHRWHKDLGGISKWRGWTIPDRELGCWICPTFHPSYVEREIKKNPASQLIFEKDLKSAIDCLNRDFPDFGDESELVEILPEVSDVNTYLQDLLDNPPTVFAFDFETTGLKPQAKGHEIVTCAISTNPEKAVAFSLKNRSKSLLKKVLADSRIKKIAANMKFEDIWSRFKLGTKVEGWMWDTMLAAHCIDNRPYITSLKFQAYVHYGLIDYDSHIEGFLKSGDNHGNAFNRIYEADRHELLVYNGLDALLEHRLARQQMLYFGILDPEYFAKHGYRRR